MDTTLKDFEHSLARFEAAMKQAGLKLTPQRVEIFKEIAGREDHPAAEDVYTSLKERMPFVSRDTVYRTLWTLNDLGLITVLGSGRESVRFDANVSKHHHFVCVQCGMIRDFENLDLSELDIKKDVEAFGSVLETQIEVRGICKRCREESKDIPDDK